MMQNRTPQSVNYAWLSRFMPILGETAMSNFTSIFPYYRQIPTLQESVGELQFDMLSFEIIQPQAHLTRKPN